MLSPKFMRPLFYVATLFTLTMALLPKPPKLVIDRFGDKFEHMLAFAVLALLARLAWRTTPNGKLLERLSFFGALIEVFQSIPMLHRDCDPRDWIADTLAVTVALLLTRKWRETGRTEHGPG